MKDLRVLFAVLPLVAGMAACDDFESVFADIPCGELRWSIAATKADIPDTNDFYLTVRDADGKLLYEGQYGDSPTSLEVPPGTYTVKAVSCSFEQPRYDNPQYGDQQSVVVKSGESVTARLMCALMCCGVSVNADGGFRASYPDGVLFLKQGTTRLMHTYTENRIAWFFPGEVTLTLFDHGEDNTLLTRSLIARDILRLSISAPAPEGGSISVAIDTTSNWIDETVVIGEDSSGSGDSMQNAISVGDAAAHAGEKGVWVLGYIVGGDLSARGASVKTSGITKSSHLAIASRSSVQEKALCVAVELPSGSKLREELNLVDHPELIGTRVYLKGNIVESYFGTTGLKGISEFYLRD